MAKFAKTVPEEKQAVEFLANERTFLAWVRTSVALISLGFVLSKFHLWIQQTQNTRGGSAGNDPGSSFKIGIGMVAFGGVVALMAAWRYHVVNRAIETGRVTADRGLIFLITFFVAILVVAMIAVLITTAGR
jgi:putative membrane protein